MVTVALCRLHRASDSLQLHAYASRSISVSVSGRCSLIPLIGISVLQSFGI
ncbi:TPA: hypothetical protein VPX87_000925 [Streptococcus pneumoniae]|nr:hypothetical protein [Streptococcus pneumoniae]